MRKQPITTLFLVVFIGIIAVGCGNKSMPSQQPESAPQQPVQQTQLAAGDATKGSTLFDTNCSGCHSSTDTTSKTTGPGLKGIYSKEKLSDGKPVNDENLTQLMKVGNAKMPGNPALSAQDFADIEVYLKTLK